MDNRAHYIRSFLILLTLVATGALLPAAAQPRYNDAINRAQADVRERIQRAEGNDTIIRFNDNPQTRSVSNFETRVSGTGTVFRRGSGRRDFTYEAVVNSRTNAVSRTSYRYTGGWGRWDEDDNRPGQNRPGGIGYADIERAQSEVRQRIERAEGRDVNVRFNDDVQRRSVANQTTVSGSGTVFQRGTRRRDFTYSAVVNNRTNAVSRVNYRYTGNWGNWDGNDNRPGGGFDWGTRPNGRIEFRGAIINRQTNKGLDVAGQSLQDGANVQQWSFANQRNQRWNIIQLRNGEYAIVNEGSDKVLDVADNRLHDNGANVQQYRWSGRDNQRWRIQSTGQGFYRIVNVASGKCLDVERKSDRDGANIHQWECNNDRSQEWRLTQ